MALRSKVFTYGAELTWQGGHTAVVAAGDRPPLPVAPPPDFPGGEDERWSPEHIFLAALESCTMLSFLAHCEHNDLEVRNTRPAPPGRSRGARTTAATRSRTSRSSSTRAWPLARQPPPAS